MGRRTATSRRPRPIWKRVKTRALGVGTAFRAMGRSLVRATCRSMSWSMMSFHVQPTQRTRKEPNTKMRFVRMRREGGMMGSLVRAARSVPKIQGKYRKRQARGLSMRASSAYGTQLGGRYDVKPAVGAWYLGCFAAIVVEGKSITG